MFMSCYWQGVTMVHEKQANVLTLPIRKVAILKRE